MQNNTQVYNQVRSSALEGRDLEASLLLRAADKLTSCAQHWNERETEEFKSKLDEALLFNQRLWTVLQVELSDPSNPLPVDLRVNLLKLSRYVDQRVFALASGGELRDIEMLSKINQEIAAGLLSRPEGQPSTDAPRAEEAAAPELDLSV